MGLFKKPIFEKKKKVSLDVAIMRARAQMDGASNKYKNIIDMEIRNVKYFRSKKTDKALEDRAIAKIKNAYYALTIIEQARFRLNDIESTNQLFSALNEMSDSIRAVNKIYGGSQKVKARRLNRNMDKMEKRTDKSDDAMKNVFAKRDELDNLVSNDVVERLIKGTRPEQCVEEQGGIGDGLSDILSIDLEGLAASDPEFNLEDIDLDELLRE